MPNVPRYEKLKLLLKDKILEDQLSVGDRFYSQNVLMRKYNLSFVTVTRALKELEREGYLIRQQGRGTFVKAIPGQEESAVPLERRVAVFTPWDFRNPAHINFQRLYSTFEASLPPNFHVKLIPYGNEPESLEQHLFSRDRFDAFVFVYPSDAHLVAVQRFAQSYPVVVVGRSLGSENLTSIYSDNQAAAEAAVSHLVGLGHRTIGMVSGDMTMTDSRERLEGYRMALAAAGIPYVESLVVYTHPFELNGYSGLIDLMDRNPDRRITAVFAAGDLIAMGALAAARVMGMRVPDDLSIIGFDDIDEAADFDPPLTTMHVPIPDLARSAAESLTMLLEGRGGHTSVELPARLVERDTVRAGERTVATGS
jgi:DNA-binding LacI/PurR family transcriptional regulator